MINGPDIVCLIAIEDGLTQSSPVLRDLKMASPVWTVWSLAKALVSAKTSLSNTPPPSFTVDCHLFYIFIILITFFVYQKLVTLLHRAFRLS